jgi:Uma2 family endonuclease
MKLLESEKGYPMAIQTEAMTVQTETLVSKPVDEEILVPQIDLPTEDGEPLESSWHRKEMNLLIDLLYSHWRDREDFYAGGNMFVYYSLEQVRTRKYRGPDFFVVRGVDGSYDRKAWVVWEEWGKYPDVIVELLSPSTANEDLTTKKTLYEQTFRTSEYFCYEPDTEALKGWRLVGGQYQELTLSDRGWLWSEQLRLWLGLWEGTHVKFSATWLRFYDEEGHLVPTEGELEAQRAEQEALARRQAEVELEEVRAELEALRRSSGNE